MTPANIYQFLGFREEGIGTICEDEADDLDQNAEKMKIYKNGYTTGQPVLRMDTDNSGRIQYRFFTFGFKAFAAEKLPDSVKSRGFLQRVIELPCIYGFPKYDIMEVTNPAGEEKFSKLLDELEHVRNLLLMYRIIHFRETIPDINLNIINRESQTLQARVTCVPENRNNEGIASCN